MATSTLIDIKSPTIDVKQHADESCKCMWFHIRSSDSNEVQLAFENVDDMRAFVHLMMIASGVNK